MAETHHTANFWPVPDYFPRWVHAFAAEDEADVGIHINQNVARKSGDRFGVKLIFNVDLNKA